MFRVALQNKAAFFFLDFHFSHTDGLADEKGKVKYIPVNELRRLSIPSSYGTLFLSIESFLLVIFNAGCVLYLFFLFYTIRQVYFEIVITSTLRIHPYPQQLLGYTDNG
ncbi:EC1118_1K5_1189p [Saccharomyces cerevisiae EC1118]|uniref:EC1118_1K5_1189p n=1 Tax=Saccharomyces cerevisiae (strain Lalvin EC1118 / Prise de mousse) TaxID=643680 RepID=C8ZC60_YEAS8|nr:EC1118_1K5_1189p [Saccharomyces cerevisiae EC1118]